MVNDRQLLLVDTSCWVDMKEDYNLVMLILILIESLVNLIEARFNLVPNPNHLFLKSINLFHLAKDWPHKLEYKLPQMTFITLPIKT